MLGLRNFLLNRLDDSQVNFEKVVSLNKNNIDAKFCLASIRMFKKNYDQAIEDFNKILLHDPQFYLCYYHLALCYFLIANHQVSLKYCEEALKIHHMPRVYDLVSMNYFELKNKIGMNRINNRINELYSNKKIGEDIYINNILVQSFELIQNDPQNFDQVTENLAKCKAIVKGSTNQELNEYVERLDYYSSVINVLKSYQAESNDQVHNEFPLDEYKFHTNSLDTYKSCNFLYLISLNYARSNQDSLCLKYIDQAIRLNDTNINFYLLKNLIFLRKKDYAGSIDLLKRAIKLIPEKNSKLRYFLAIAYSYMNKKEEASEHLNHLIPKEYWYKNISRNFSEYDLVNEVKSIEWYNYEQTYDPVPKLVKEKI